MRILAIDCGKTLGWASVDNGHIESGVVQFALKRGESAGMIFVLFRNWMKRALRENRPEMVVYEQAHHRGGYATRILTGMTTRIEEICADNSIEYTPIHSMTLKKTMTGKGNANKAMMVEEAKRRFPDIEIIDDNQADALLLLDYARKEYGDEQISTSQK